MMDCCSHRKGNRLEVIAKKMRNKLNDFNAMGAVLQIEDWIPLEEEDPILELNHLEKKKKGESGDEEFFRPNGEALRKCILSVPYKPITVLVQAVEATDDSPVVPEHTTIETPMNMSPENKAHFLAEKEAIHLILTGIGDEIYSTVDASQTAQEMWEAIESLQQGESLNIQDMKTNLFW
nr:hypothetical protein [Tanacetum cinerariifolium]